MFRLLAISIFTLIAAHASLAQVNGVSINASGASPDPSAIIDVSSSTQGALIPRMTTTERNAIVNPADGLHIYNTTTKCLNIYIGSAWKQLCGDCDFNSPVAGNNGPICEGSTLNLTATSISGATYQWSGPNGFTSNQQNPSVTNATAGASGSYSVTATLNGCTSQLQTTVATVNATPVAPLATNSGPGCVGSPLNLYAATVTGASYIWTGPNGYSANTQNPTIISAQSTDGGTFNVTATVNGCISSAGSTTAVVNTIPVSTFTPLTSYDDIETIFSPTTNGATYSWVFSSGSPSTSTAQNPAVTWSNTGVYNTSLTVTVNGCSSTTTSAINVLSPPKNCQAIKTANSSSPDGVYTVFPSTGSLNVYCDMTTDDGGWTLVYRDNHDGIITQGGTSSLGTLSNLQSVSGASAKYSDAVINALKTNASGTGIGFRTSSPTVVTKYYHPSGCTYVHNSNSNPCMQAVSSYTTSGSPSYAQFVEWGGGGGGINCWYKSGDYQNTVTTSKSDSYSERGGITNNPGFTTMGSSSTSYSNVVLMWVR